MQRIPVLLTSSVIAHDTSVALQDASTRAQLTLQGVAQWLRLRPTAPLVLCDGSGYNLSNELAQAFPAAVKAQQIEVLQFHNDVEKVRRQGRGFGEGEIVRYALAHSQHIQAAGAFAKCSAKLWVENFDDCTAQWLNQPSGQMLCHGVFRNVFSPIKPTRLAYIDTRFYVASADFYQQLFLNAHFSIDAARGQSLEECFLAQAQQQQLRHVFFKIPPVVEGVGGGIGRAYRTPWHRRAKEQLRIAFVRRQADFASYF